MMRPVFHIALAGALVSATAPLAAQDADAAGRAFADHCFSPYLTAETAQTKITPSGARLEFYDLHPFSSASASPVTGRAATPGTDRRCEVAFDGAHQQKAIEWLGTGLEQEGLTNRKARVPDGFISQSGMTLIAAAQLNPNRIAIVQIGVRAGPNGDETFINVERLTPLDEAG